MITWGLVGNSHDASLAVWQNNRLQFATKTTRAEHNKQLFDTVIDQYGKPTEIVWYERPFLKTLRQLRAGQGWLWKQNNIKNYLKQRGIESVPIKYTQHHLSHAAYAYYTQPDDDCAVICLDSIGEFETLTIWHGKNNTLKKIHTQNYPHSLGLFYSAMTQRMGFTPQRDEYLVAQHAAAGDPHRLTTIMLNEIIDIPTTSHWSYWALNSSDRPYIRMRENLHRGCLWWRPELNTVQDMADIAAATQTCFEMALKKLSNWAYWRTGGKKLALAGGGALNRQAIDKIRKDWPNVWVPPNPGDPGSSVGCILAHKKIKIDNINSVWQ
jgi:carbamoyltransferase